MSFCTPGSFMEIALEDNAAELSARGSRSSQNFPGYSALLRKPYFGIAADNAVFKIIPQQKEAALRYGKLPGSEIFRAH